MPDPTSPNPPAPTDVDFAAIVKRLQDAAQGNGPYVSDVAQAQAQAQAAIERANNIPLLARMFASPDQILAAKRQRLEEARIPLEMAAGRLAARDAARAEAGKDLATYGQGLSARLAMERYDPNGPMMQYVRANAPAGRTIPPGLSPAYLEAIDPQFKSLIDTYAKEQEGKKAGAEAEHTTALTGPDVVAKRAEAAKTGAEAERTRALVEPEKAEKMAGAEKASAEAAHTRMLTSGEVAPDYYRGNIPIDEAEATKINDQFRDYKKAKAAVARILELTGGSDFIASPELRAKLQPQINGLVAELRGSTGIRQLAGPELDFAKKIIADPTVLSVSNLTRWSHNQARLKSLEESLDRGWNSTVAAKGLRYQPGGERNVGTPPNTIKMKFPDGKVIPVHATRIEDAIRAGATRVGDGR